MPPTTRARCIELARSLGATKAEAGEIVDGLVAARESLRRDGAEPKTADVLRAWNDAQDAAILHQPDGAGAQGAAPPASAAARGAFLPGGTPDDPRPFINLFRGRADISTVVHEAGHLFLENFRLAAMREGSPQWVKDAWATLQKEIGVADAAGAIPTDAHEKFARHMERYLADGRAPSAALDGVFSRFRSWLADLWAIIRGGPNLKISDDLRNVLDRMLATEQEIRAWRDGGMPRLDAGDAMRSRLSPRATGALQRGLMLSVLDMLRDGRVNVADIRRVINPALGEAEDLVARLRRGRSPFPDSLDGDGGFGWRDPLLDLVDEEIAGAGNGGGRSAGPAPFDGLDGDGFGWRGDAPPPGAAPDPADFSPPDPRPAPANLPEPGADGFGAAERRAVDRFADRGLLSAGDVDVISRFESEAARLDQAEAVGMNVAACVLDAAI